MPIDVTPVKGTAAGSRLYSDSPSPSLPFSRTIMATIGQNRGSGATTMNLRRHRGSVVALLAVGGAAATLWAADARRAPPPKFDSAVVNDIFFSDARKHLGPGGPPVPGQVLIASPGVPGASAA